MMMMTITIMIMIMIITVIEVNVSFGRSIFQSVGIIFKTYSFSYNDHYNHDYCET